MNRNVHASKTIGLALTTALATIALSGCATNAPRADLAAGKAQAALAQGNVETAVASAEAAVLAEPRNAAYRAVLGAAYMEAGRFGSAAQSFDDAMALGDATPRTALSLALAKIAVGKRQQAVALLDDWRDDIGAADLGLALALAGEPDRGVHVLSNTLRGGENTPKVRQNLAYALALQGNWQQASLMAAEDVPLDQLHARMTHWAGLARPEFHHRRVADLLNAPLRNDPGQPMRLALDNYPSVEQLAAEAAALAPAAVVPPPVYTADATGELPAVASMQAIDPTPAVAVETYPSPRVEKPADFAQAFAADAPTGNTPMQVASTTVRFISEPVVQKAVARFGAEQAPRMASRRTVASPAARHGAGFEPRVSGGPARPAAAPTASATPASASATGGDHLIQLGSFFSEQGARRAWGIYASRYPELGEHEMVITEARVRGKTYYRVSAAGFAQGGAQSLCGKVKASGQGCIAWAKDSPLPGAIASSARMARR